MRLGLIARADNSGLGIQTWEFYRHMPIAKTLLVDLSSLNGNKTFPERYPGAQQVGPRPTAGDIREFLTGLDVVFVAEAPYNYELYSIAKEMGVKTAVQYNYEFFDWFAYPHYPTPDMLIAPSRWHYGDVQRFCDERGIKHVYLHCPVDREKLPKREIKQARTFLHMAGKPASYDRNGTRTVIEASKLIKSEVTIKIHFQGKQGLTHQTTDTIEDYIRLAEEHGDMRKLDIEVIELPEYQDAYTEGDVLLLPRRYGGNCLPLNEALSVGMPVIMPNISPNDWLPQQWLLPAMKINEFAPRTIIDIYNVAPEHLAAKIDELAAMTEDEFRDQTGMANAWASQISWATMAPMYLKELEALCTPF